MNNARTTITGLPNVDGLRSRPILSPRDQQVPTFDRTVDSRTALARGLAEYFSDQSMVWHGGRLIRFENIEVTWAEPEVPNCNMAGSLVNMGPGIYDDAEFTPITTALPDGRILRAVSEMSQTFAFVIWSADPVMRMGLTALIEDAMNPTDWMSGLRLELPFYFNARATYEHINVDYDDNAQDARRRWRRAVVIIKGNVPQLVPVGDIPRLQPQSDITVTDDVSKGVETT